MSRKLPEGPQSRAPLIRLLTLLYARGKESRPGWTSRRECSSPGCVAFLCKTMSRSSVLCYSWTRGKGARYKHFYLFIYISHSIINNFYYLLLRRKQLLIAQTAAINSHKCLLLLAACKQIP